MTNIVSFIHNIFDVANKFIYGLVAAFILIIITYGTSIKNSKIFSLLFKISIVVIYFYLFTINYRYIKKLFDTTGIFSNPELSKLRIFLFLFTLFEISLVVVIMYVLYTILF
jgi:hypothetical protein